VVPPTAAITTHLKKQFPAVGLWWITVITSISINAAVLLGKYSEGFIALRDKRPDVTVERRNGTPLARAYSRSR
jgi:hypothetical protein